MTPIYLETARLLTQIAPLVLVDDYTFALKGGTAINLFARDMPRLSVDLVRTNPSGEALRVARADAQHSSGEARPLLVRWASVQRARSRAI